MEIISDACRVLEVWPIYAWFLNMGPTSQNMGSISADYDPSNVMWDI